MDRPTTEAVVLEADRTDHHSDLCHIRIVIDEEPVITSRGLAVHAVGRLGLGDPETTLQVGIVTFLAHKL